MGVLRQIRAQSGITDALVLCELVLLVFVPLCVPCLVCVDAVVNCALHIIQEALRAAAQHDRCNAAERRVLLQNNAVGSAHLLHIHLLSENGWARV